MKIHKPVAKLVLVTQILFPLMFSSMSVASAVNLSSEEVKNQELLAKIQSSLPELSGSQADDVAANNFSDEALFAKGLTQSAQAVNSDDSGEAVKNLAQSTAYGFIGQQMSDWLNQYGNSRIQINTDKTFSGELLLPLYDSENNLFFSQSRIQRQDEDRTTLNLGLGYRNFYSSNMMWGVNSFYDRDLKNNNARWGLGAELGADYIKFAANGYFRLTDWRQSRLSHFKDYDERPANGFDIRAEGFLPSYPYLGANVKYEKYFGDNVNLKGTNSTSNLKPDPQAYTVGISYTPFPMVSFKLNQAMGDINETKGEFSLNYRFGVPLSQQLDAGFVPQMRTLMGARYDFIDRNNTIVMQYKKNEKLAFTTTSLPDGTVGVPYSQQLAASGGDGRYAYSIIEGSLPAGLSLSTDGWITGTPETSGEKSTTVVVQDSRGLNASSQLHVHIYRGWVEYNWTGEVFSIHYEGDAQEVYVEDNYTARWYVVPKGEDIELFIDHTTPLDIFSDNREWVATASPGQSGSVHW